MEGSSMTQNINDEGGCLYLDRGSWAHQICLGYNIINPNARSFLDIYSKIWRVKGNNSEEQLICMMDNLEKLFKQELLGKDWYEMLYISRRVGIQNVYDCIENEVILYRNIVNLSFQKYCDFKERYKIIGEYSILPSIFEKFDINNYFQKDKELVPLNKLNRDSRYIIRTIANSFSTYYSVEMYACYLMYLTKTYRTVCKGARLMYDQEMAIRAVSDEELVNRTHLFDVRNRRFSILGSSGGYADLNLKQNIDDDEMFIFMVTQENLNRIKFSQILNSLGDDYKKHFVQMEEDTYPNYMMIPIDIKDYYFYVKNFDEDFKEYYSFTIEDFLVFFKIIYLGNIMEIDKNPVMLMQILQRGYTSYDYNILRNNFIDNYSVIMGKYNFTEDGEDKGKLFDMIFDILRYYPSQDKKIINLKSIGPRKVFNKIDDTKGIIDYTQWVSILEQIIQPICKDSDEKGNVFEEIVIRKVEDIFGEDSFWINQTKIKANKKEREIDVSFKVDDLLVILECKATNMSISSYIGDRAAVDFREAKNKKAIAQADKTLKFICDNYSDLNHPLPKGVKGIVSLIVTPSAEYIWEFNDNTMINDKLPRILTINELVLLKSLSLNKCLKNKNFFKVISNN